MHKANGRKVFVAISGGVDSAVSAALLQSQGYDVEGVFMKNWSGDNFGIQADCPWEEDQRMAQLVCQHLNIPFRTYNFEKVYRQEVVDYFFGEYQAGRTPNPDVMCNKTIKFGVFLQKCLQNGADLIATGHYARHHTTGDQETLLKGIDPGKDQTYFLHQIDQYQLAHTLFPIGNLPKSQVRKLAFAYKLPNAARPDSQGICFIGKIDVLEFLMSRIKQQPGEVVDVDTEKVVGQHRGIYFYTIGQREGLGIGGQSIPYFVVDKDPLRNIVYVGHGHDHPRLLSRVVRLENLHQIRPIKHDEPLQAAIRYQHKPQPGLLDVTNMVFSFDQPQRAVTPGQSLVLYCGEECIGGGVIQNSS